MQPTEVGPIATMPTEILIEIFGQVKLMHERDILNEENPLPAAVILSHVMHHWREVSLCTPLLWSTITIYENHPLDLLRACLSRSAECLLDVSLISWGYVDEDTLQLIISEIGRCRPLVIETYEEMSLNHIVQALRAISLYLPFNTFRLITAFIGNLVDFGTGPIYLQVVHRSLRLSVYMGSV